MNHMKLGSSSSYSASSLRVAEHALVGGNSGCKVVKAWGVHQVSEIVTLGDIYCGIIAGTVESGSPFQMPPELQDQPFVR